MHSAGLIDLQVNGFAGVDFNSTALTADALDHALRAMLRTGVTSCLPTLITAPEDVLAERFAAKRDGPLKRRKRPVRHPQPAKRLILPAGMVRVACARGCRGTSRRAL